MFQNAFQANHLQNGELRCCDKSDKVLISDCEMCTLRL